MFYLLVLFCIALCNAASVAPVNETIIPIEACDTPVKCPRIACPLIRACAEDEELVTEPCECCPTCRKKINPCALVRCAMPVCPKGYIRIKKGCCYVCIERPVICNCLDVMCPMISCPPTQLSRFVEPCSCCPTCYFLNATITNVTAT